MCFLLPRCLLVLWDVHRELSSSGSVYYGSHVSACARWWFQGRKVRCVFVSGSNWVELVLMGLYGMFGVISVWGVLAPLEDGLAPCPAPSSARSCSASHFPSLSWESQGLYGTERASDCLCVLHPEHCDLRGPSPLIAECHFKGPSEQPGLVTEITWWGMS